MTVINVLLLARDCSERQLQDAVIPYAQMLGWKAVHFRPARVLIGGRQTYRTAVQGDGKGFPDCLFLRRDRGVAAELKRVGQKPKPEQRAWLTAFAGAGFETYCWTPADAAEIATVLS